LPIILDQTQHAFQKSVVVANTFILTAIYRCFSRWLW